MTEPSFSCDRPFDIDDVQLDGLSPQQCFVLGYELAQVDSLLRSGCEFSKPIHANNAERIKAELERQGREHTMEWFADDRSESWMHLTVKARTG